MIWIIFILLYSVVHWYMIDQRKYKPIYTQEFIFRGIAAILYGRFVLDIQDEAQIFTWLGYTTFTFLFLFNTLLNTFRGKALDYVGAESGWTDRFIHKHNLQRVWYWVTFISFIIAIKYFS